MDDEIFSVDKNPEKYDEYKFTLNKLHKNIAETYLNETESTRDQALTQMREWIAKDPYIKQCRTDSNFLLRFLRTKKFNVQNAFILLQRNLTNRILYPEWFRSLDVDEPVIKKLLLDGFFIPLPEKDEKGRQVLIFSFKNLDHTKYLSRDVYRLQEMILQFLLDDEEVQIAGYVLVFDYSAIHMGHLGMFSLLDFKNFISCIRKSIPIRVTSILVLKLPNILQAFYEVTMAVIPPKLKARFKVYKAFEDFQKVINIDMFPEEYGGKLKTKQILEDFSKKIAAKREKILALDDMCIELTKNMKPDWFQQDANCNMEAGIIGSFRKLQVD